jgi:hypothetical protein
MTATGSSSLPSYRFYPSSGRAGDREEEPVAVAAAIGQATLECCLCPCDATPGLRCICGCGPFCEDCYSAQLCPNCRRLDKQGN